MIMTKDEKKKLLNELESNAMYQSSIESISSEKERRQIKAFVDDVYINLVSSLTGLLSLNKEIKVEDGSTTIPNE